MRKDTWKASVASLVGVASEDRRLPFLLLPLLAMEEITPLLPTCPVCVLLTPVCSQGLPFGIGQPVSRGRAFLPLSAFLSVL